MPFHLGAQLGIRFRKVNNAILSGLALPDAISSGLTSSPNVRKTEMLFIWTDPDAILSELADAIYADRYCMYVTGPGRNYDSPPSLLPAEPNGRLS